jgi:hypothetical protein
MILPDESWIAKAWEHLRGRRASYKRKFADHDPDTQAILHDLMEFCRVGKTLWDPDPYMRAVLVGRQEVALRILEHLHLPPERHFELAMGKSLHVIRAETAEADEI